MSFFFFSFPDVVGGFVIFYFLFFIFVFVGCYGVIIFVVLNYTTKGK